MKSALLVTGANGHIGFNLVRHFVARGYPVKAGVRAGAFAKTLHPLQELKAQGQVELCEIDLFDLDSLKRSMEGVQGVFHTAAPHVSWSKDPENDFVRPYLQGTLNVLKVAHQQGVRKAILTS